MKNKYNIPCFDFHKQNDHTYFSIFQKSVNYNLIYKNFNSRAYTGRILNKNRYGIVFGKFYESNNVHEK